MRHILYVFSLLLLFACSRNEKKAETRTVFRYNESSGITSLDPAFAKDQANIWACNQLYSGLLQLDDELNIKPCIAKSWEVEDHGETYIFQLRSGVYFHQHEIFGEQVSRSVRAADFIYSFNRIIDDNLASPGLWVFNNVKRKTDGWLDLSAPNDSTLIIHLKKSFPAFPGILCMQYCSVIPEEAVDNFGKDFRNHPVGTGPFCFKMWKEGIKLIFVKNDGYFEFEGGNRLPYLDAVAITFLKDKQSAFMEFVKGNLEFISGIDQSYKDEILTADGELNPDYKDRFSLIKRPFLNTEYLAFMLAPASNSLLHSGIKNKKVRQAINYGIDKDKMIRYLRNNIGIPGRYGFLPVGIPGNDTSEIDGYNYDPDRARSLLTEAGFPGGDGLDVITLSSTPEHIDICKYIQHQLQDIGITLEIDIHPPAMLKEFKAQSKLPFFRASWIADYPDAENYLSLFNSENFSPAGPNYTHYSNPAFDSLYNLSQSETDDSVRFDYYRKMDQIVMEESPVVVLYYDEVLRFVSKNVTGLGSNPVNLLDLKKVRKSREVFH